MHMNITLVNTWRVINAKGGAEKVFCDMANALSRRGHNVTAICYDNIDGKPGFPLDDEVKLINAGLVSTPLYMSRFARKIRTFSFTRTGRRRKRTSIKGEVLKYKLDSALTNVVTDVVISFQIETTYALKSILGNSVPLITMLHGKPSNYFSQDLSTSVKSAVESSDAIQVLRPEFTKEVSAILPKANIVVIPNVVPQFQETAKVQTSTIINVGRISPEKRQSLLIEAFNLIKDQFPDWKLELWGETCYCPKYAEQIKLLIKEKELDNRVLICGTTDNVPLQLKKASLFVFPSEHEGWGLALTEAMSIGLPTIGCKDCSAVNTLIKDGVNGYLCDSTPKSLAEAMAKLMSNRNTRTIFGKNAKDEMKIYSPKYIWDQWENLLLSLLNSSDNSWK